MTLLILMEKSEVNQTRRDECRCMGSAVAVASRLSAESAENVLHVQGPILHLLQADHGNILSMQMTIITEERMGICWPCRNDAPIARPNPFPHRTRR